MYNRYIPQPDGSYRRNRMPDAHRSPSQRSPAQEPPAKQEYAPPPPPPPTQVPIVSGGSITGFLRQLLPKDFDTADLIIVLLLLLMAGDNEKERSTALLTMALYFIM